MSRIVKRSILWAILAIIAYWIIGWIVKDIYFSMADIGMDETLEDIWKREMGVYTVVAAIIAGICCLGCADGVENEEILYYLLGISGIAIGAVFLTSNVNGSNDFSKFAAYCSHSFSRNHVGYQNYCESRR